MGTRKPTPLRIFDVETYRLPERKPGTYELDAKAYRDAGVGWLCIYVPETGRTHHFMREERLDEACDMLDGCVISGFNITGFLSD